ncbi:arsenate reductase/protein-tyrosine-phosphatase family protein [Limosilactobacillus reuteri]|uniref:arsenate reductase/protein-tyrosine-phosphatase family protein n=1 Tax=Limosilactobacillus reuteri TaxID=1598 RepID=UPI001CDB48A6|nr:low molecular weight phosphotyrosine protein phosphatase [Limosilactobacillus reuteri]
MECFYESNFVCLGNICRSPMAEGSLADSRTKAIFDKYHIKDDGMIARQLRDRDYYDADYIIAMDQMNVRDAKDMAPAGLENMVHGIFEATPGKENCYIVAPWITHRFQNTYDSLSEALPNWLAKLKKEIK